MVIEPGFESEPLFCGNCGTPVPPGSRGCVSCGQPVVSGEASGGEAPRTGNYPPAGYVPYCRTCGIGVAWGEGHACSRCGLAPLCAPHFLAAKGLCLECADAPAFGSAPGPVGGLRCGACGSPVSPDTGFCFNCGRALAVPYEAQEYMGFWVRTAAFVADWVVAYVLAALVAAVIGIPLTSGDADTAAMEDVYFVLENFNYGFLLLFCAMSTAHSVILTVLRGQTLGKMLLRIQVVDATGNVPPWPRAVTRELLRGVVLLALFPLGLLYIWVGLDSRKRGLHDYVGRSYVVRRQRRGNSQGRIF